MVCAPEAPYIKGGEISREELLEKIAEFRLLDDTYMTVFFDGHPELIELVLSIILDRDDLKVTGSQIQKPLKNIQGHSSILDIYAVDGKNTVYNIEIQSRSDGAGPKRARYYSSLIDSNNLDKNEDYENLPETYVIFFTAADVFGKDLPIYTVNRTVDELGHIPFGDDEHIIYVNGNRMDDTPLGKLVHDFKCKKPSEMFYEKLAERAHDIKETNGGNDSMCEIMEELRVRADAFARKDTARQTAVKMLKRNKLFIEEIAEDSGLTLEEVKALAAETRTHEPPIKA